MEAAESADCSLMDRDIMQVIFALAKAGHQQHIPQMVERLKQERGYVPGTLAQLTNLAIMVEIQVLRSGSLRIHMSDSLSISTTYCYWVLRLTGICLLFFSQMPWTCVWASSPRNRRTQLLTSSRVSRHCRLRVWPQTPPTWATSSSDTVSIWTRYMKKKASLLIFSYNKTQFLQNCFTSWLLLFRLKSNLWYFCVSLNSVSGEDQALL